MLIAKNREAEIDVQTLEEARAWCANGWIGDIVRVYETTALHGTVRDLRCVAAYKRISVHDAADYDDVGAGGTVELDV